MPAAEPLRWYYFIPRSGDEGDRWYREYRDSSCMELTVRLDAAISLLRGHRLDEGRALLEHCGDQLDALRGRTPAQLVRVAERWFFSTTAYYRYVIGDSELAGSFLARAADAIAEAIHRARFLVVMAGACCEFQLHRARIARQDRDWDAMHRHLETGRAMLEDRRPLCHPAGGEPIYFRDLDRFHRSLVARCPEEIDALAQLTDRDLRARGYEAQVRRVELLPGVVVPFR